MPPGYDRITIFAQAAQATDIKQATPSRSSGQFEEYLLNAIVARDA
jgi:hypothetical protein